MRNLETTFENPFESPELIIDNKIKFGEDALHRFPAQNTGGIYTTVIDAMTTAQAALIAKTTGVMTDASKRETFTIDTDEAMLAFTRRVTKLNRVLVANEVNKQSVYQQFFPQGVEEFTTHITKENIEVRMQFMIDAITNNLAVAGGKPVLDEFVNIQQEYLKARGGQLDKKGATNTTRSQRNTAEEAWNDAFFDALLAAARANRNHPERLSLFFDQSILRTAKNPATDGKGRLSGTLTFEGGAPVQGAVLHVIDGNINNATTTATGTYATQYLLTNTYVVNITLHDKLIHTSTINIVDDGDTKLDLVIPVG